MSKITEDFLYPFSVSQLSTVEAIAARMSEYGISPNEVVEMVRQHHLAMTQKMQADGRIKEVLPAPSNRRQILCPECGSPCVVHPVNVSKCTQVGGEWQSVIVCSSGDCRYTELSKKSLNEWKATPVKRGN